MANITFKDKVDFVTNPLVPDEKKIKSTDMNEIKSVVNDKADKIHKHTKTDITDFPTSLPASGGNSATVGGKTPEVLQNYANLQNKPTSFPPSKHSHDDLYFTETEVTEKLKSKADDVTYKNNMLQLTANGTPIGTPIEVVSGSGGSGGLSSDTLPVGTMVPFSGTTISDGWLLCEGQAVSRSTYKSLFDIIGTSYGVGNGTTTFNVPKMSNPMSYELTGIKNDKIQFKTVNPEAYYIIKARQMIPFTSSVEDNLTSDSKTNGLSAAQGKALKKMVDNVNPNMRILGEKDLYIFAYDGTTRYYAGTYARREGYVDIVGDRLFIDFNVKVSALGDISKAPNTALIYIQILNIPKYITNQFSPIGMYNIALSTPYNQLGITMTIVEGNVCMQVNRFSDSGYSGLTKGELSNSSALIGGTNYRRASS